MEEVVGEGVVAISEVEPVLEVVEEVVVLGKSIKSGLIDEVYEMLND
jgi:hypothetical protein